MATISEALAIALGHHQGGRLREAEQIYRQILAADPNHVDALHLLGVVAFEIGKPAIAVEYIRRAIELHGTESAFYGNLGNAFQAEGELNQAVACFRRALELDPDNAVAQFNLGNALRAQERLDEAAEAYGRALELKPDHAVAHNNLGGVLQSLGEFDAAVQSYRQALALEPNYAQAHSNLGTAFKQFGRFDDALTSYARALELEADCAFAHFGQSTLNLLQGDFERGWPEYEWRWKTGELVERKFSQPRWEGNPLGERTILLHAEQGFGDTLQFVRYAAMVKQQNAAATVVVECQRPLANLLGTCAGIDRLVSEGEELPPFDVHLPLLSLPGIFKTTVETIPASVPYLFADAALVAHWRERLKEVGGQSPPYTAKVSGLRVGINWRGRALTRQRDIPLERFAGLAKVPGVRLVSLQKGEGRGELVGTRLPQWADAHRSLVNLGNDFDTMHGAFMDTAAVMMNLDLVITSDTAIPHLAGALGVPVWLALPYVPDWRWLLDRSDSPWYPTMRLFRQQRAGDWAGVFAEMEGALRRKPGH